ncbi:hypothetical protein [Limnofasciculus baicalensis]|uniref:Outer membrane protein beta-barrel domain-containing protein n=1 Tax=Limnofasciculus baicalensis BBK-W-15 TaxID=2699891 RepID=A0AAE3KNC9_9CYAN|nr:hypothetical protein [Limnofasciculus baicalensis]MCP2729691.1 hypothetical protein [Limnofasciculus baicalensis BBK-W-15]
MKNTVFRPISHLLGIGALTIASSSLSAHGEIPSANKSLELLPAAGTTSFVEEGTTQAALTQTRQETVDSQSPSNVVNSALSVEPRKPKYDPLFGFNTPQPNLQSVNPTRHEPSVNPTRHEPSVNPTRHEQSVNITRHEEINPNPGYIAHIDKPKANSQIGQLKQISNHRDRTPERANSAIATSAFRIPRSAPAQPIAANPLAQPIPAPPIPGEVGTSAQLLIAPQIEQSVQQAFRLFSNKPKTILAQADLDPRRGTTARVPNYIGIGGNLGLSDNSTSTSLGDGGFVVNGKISLTPKLSLRPAAILGNDATFLIPLTYDFLIPAVDPFEPVRFAPFLGGGLAISTDDDNSIGFLFTGGIDVPISRAFVANASINLGFIEDETDFGLMIGVGYTFPKP